MSHGAARGPAVNVASAVPIRGRRGRATLCLGGRASVAMAFEPV